MDNSTKKRPIFLCFIRKNRTKWQKWGQKSYPHLCRVIHNLHKKWRVIHIYARVIHNLSTIWQKLSTIHFSRNFFTEKKKERENTELALCGAGNTPRYRRRWKTTPMVIIYYLLLGVNSFYCLRTKRFSLLGAPKCQLSA